MKISKAWLEKQDACSSGIEWFVNQKEKDGFKVVKELIKQDKLPWANWLIVRIMSYKQYVSYGVYAAEYVIDIYEKIYPDDKRPREAIEAAKKCIENPSKKNKGAAAEAAEAAAEAAAWAAGAARAAEAAEAAAEAAAWAAGAARAAEAAEAAAEAAAWAAGAARAAEAAEAAMQKKILDYGINLLSSLKKEGGEE